MSKQTGNLVRRRKLKQALDPPIVVKRLVAQFQQHPAYALARLKRANDKQLVVTALALGKQYEQLDDGDETKEAMGQLIVFIRNLVAERRKTTHGNTDA